MVENSAPVSAVAVAPAPGVDAAPAPVARFVSEVCNAVNAVDAVDEDDAADAVDEVDGDEAVDGVDVVGTASTQPTPSKQPAVIAATAPVVKFFEPVPDRSTCGSGGRDGVASKGASSCGGLHLKFRRP